MFRQVTKNFTQSSQQQKIKVSKGTKFQLYRLLTKEDVLKFAELSGDKNLVHTSQEVAAKTMFKEPIAHGMLGASLFSKLLGMNMPGCIYLKQNLGFTQPIYWNEIVRAEVEVTEVDAKKKRVNLSTSVFKVTRDSAQVRGVIESAKIDVEGLNFTGTISKKVYDQELAQILNSTEVLAIKGDAFIWCADENLEVV